MEDDEPTAFLQDGADLLCRRRNVVEAAHRAEHEVRDRGVERAAHRGKVSGGADETEFACPPCRDLPRDHLRRHIDPEHPAPAVGEERGEIAAPAADIEHIRVAKDAELVGDGRVPERPSVTAPPT